MAVDMKTKKPELVAPAGDRTMLAAAVNAGADAVYFGVKGFNMRARAKNFETRDLKSVATYCHKRGVKAYLALNSLIYESELPKMRRIVAASKKAGIDRIICWDPSVIEEARSQRIPVTISTQASVSNSAAAEFYRKVGADRIVLARECSLPQIRQIKKRTDVQLEVFAHGAMCISISGRCLLSHHLFKKSANRGECLQPCRRKYQVKEYLAHDPEGDDDLVIGEDYVLSPKDLCTLPFIDSVIAAGVDALKIEGRNRSPEYVDVVTRCYREAVDASHDGLLTDGLIRSLQKRLTTVYTRGPSRGFYCGPPMEDDLCASYGSVAKTEKRYIGVVTNFYRKASAAEVKLEASDLRSEDHIMVQGPTTGVVDFRAESLQVDGTEVSHAKKGQMVGVAVPVLVRKNDKVYVVGRRVEA